MRDNNGPHAFGNNSAESEPIWMTSRTVWAKCRGLALANFGRDPSSSDSLRGIAFPKKRQNCSQNFPVLQLQAVITPQWLQIVGNSRTNGPSAGCLVSIFTVRITSNSFSSAVRCSSERHLPKFSATSDVRSCVLKRIVRCGAGAVLWAIYWWKADWIGNWK